jgi:chemotaxis methyl-accepting protein methylase
MPDRMNQYPDSETFSLKPDLRPFALEANLSRIFVPGTIMDRTLERYCCLLQERFRVYCSTCPAPEWGQGLIVTPEIRSQTEIYLPVSEIQSAFRYLLCRSIRYEPFLPAFMLFSTCSWPDALGRFCRPPSSSNPAEFIRLLARDEDSRRVFLASTLVPSRYGGEFGRYPLQMNFLKEWLCNRRRQGFAGVEILDAACGSGEQSYEVAEQLLDIGWDSEHCTVVGETVEPLELAAAAHGWFPHDRARETAFRRRVEGILTRGGGSMLSFVSRDLRSRAESGKQYDVVICNGLIGGPLLNDTAMVLEVIRRLAERVGKGGLFLAADRFHAGWRKSVPIGSIRAAVEAAGFAIVDGGEGVAAVRL